MGTPNWSNQTIWTGDCLPIMRGMNSESVDLIYLDPPFNSNANYAAPIGSQAAGAAFKDTWTLTDVDVEWINLIEAKYPTLYRVLLAAVTNSDKSYLAYMAARILEMQRLLKPTGSLYLHCDPTMSHYLKLVLDAVFGRRAFRNEIVWHYRRWPAKQPNFQRMHDTIFFYSSQKGDNIFNQLMNPLSPGTKKRWRGKKSHVAFAETGERLVTQMTDQDSTGAPMDDVWDIAVINSQAKERLGYPTQKPLVLLERIIAASSNDGDMVLDPFCGCATTLVAAYNSERNWAGIDISPKAAELVVQRLENRQGIFQDIVHRTDIPKRTDLGPLPRYNCEANRKTLYGEQGGHCAGCLTHFEARHLEVDHIIAKQNGGTDHLANLQLLCGNCNRIKGDRGMEYLQAKLQL